MVYAGQQLNLNHKCLSSYSCYFTSPVNSIAFSRSLVSILFFNDISQHIEWVTWG